MRLFAALLVGALVLTVLAAAAPAIAGHGNAFGMHRGHSGMSLDLVLDHEQPGSAP